MIFEEKSKNNGNKGYNERTFHLPGVLKAAEKRSGNVFDAGGPHDAASWRGKFSSPPLHDGKVFLHRRFMTGNFSSPPPMMKSVTT